MAQISGPVVVCAHDTESLVTYYASADCPQRQLETVEAPGVRKRQAVGYAREDEEDHVDSLPDLPWQERHADAVDLGPKRA